MSRAYTAEQRARQNERVKAYYKRHREEKLEYARKYYKENRETILAKKRKERRDNPEIDRKHNAVWRAKLRQDVLIAYGNACECCGEMRHEFLAIDHINGNGNKHRKSIKRQGGTKFYLWLRQNDYPVGYRILCHNCNMALGMYGYCPHEQEKQLEPIMA